MDQGTVKIENEVIAALKYVEENRNFVIEGGAGSGKTYSLVSLIDEIKKTYPDKTVACITYTNNAANEILQRISYKDIWVSTIHEFMWTLISQFQGELKKELVEFLNSESDKKFLKPKGYEDKEVDIEYFNGLRVVYDDFYSMQPSENGCVRVSHDHVLMLAERLFAKYSKLSDILKDFANCILVDEYQDTSPLVTKILLEHLPKSNKKTVVGFFGDPMQAIYSSTNPLDSYDVIKIVKEKNHRNPEAVIELANKFRGDGLRQISFRNSNEDCSEEDRIGSAIFIFGKDLPSEKLRELPFFETWDFTNPNETKELRLTHRYNAEMAGFKNLFAVYNDDPVNILLDKLPGESDETLDNLAKKVNPKKYGKPILTMIEDSVPQEYSYIKNLSLTEARKKCFINRDSWKSIKMDETSGKYKTTSGRDDILHRLDLLNEIIELYNDNQINEFLKRTSFDIQTNADKRRLKEIMENIQSETITIREVLELAKNEGLIKKDDLFEKYISNRGFYLWKRLEQIKFIEHRNSLKYMTEYFPFSTQHSVKGSEFDNVLISLESNWSKYNFEKLFIKGTVDSNDATTKLFYVCVTRAKKNLVVYYPGRTSKVIENAKKYFGEDNVFDILDL